VKRVIFHPANIASDAQCREKRRTANIAGNQAALKPDAMLAHSQDSASSQHEFSTVRLLAQN
jgi:hypothetical protein